MSNLALPDRLFDLDNAILEAKATLKRLEKSREGLEKEALLLLASDPGAARGAYGRIRVESKVSTTTSWQSIAKAYASQDDIVAATKTTTKTVVVSDDGRDLDPMGHYIALDCETTGFGDADRLVSLGIARCDAGRVGYDETFRFNPGIPIPAKASEVHGITDAMAAREQPFASFARSIARILDEGGRLVAHNAGFDVRMLGNEFRRIGMPVPAGLKDCVDTLPLARRLAPGESGSFDAVLARFGLSRSSGRHDAGEDARLLAQLIPELLGAIAREQA